MVEHRGRTGPADSGGPLSTEAAYRRYRTQLFNYFRRCGVPAAAAEDLTQRVFILLLEDPARYDPSRGPLQHYLFGVARNLRHAWERERKRVVEIDPSFPAGHRRNEASMSVRQAVDALPEDQREALILREFHGFDYESIARLQNVPVGTVRSRLSRARETLRQMLR
jgi:RNA polymerase sigma-70 factor (ECF subfamily)